MELPTLVIVAELLCPRALHIQSTRVVLEVPVSQTFMVSAERRLSELDSVEPSLY